MAKIKRHIPPEAIEELVQQELQKYYQAYGTSIPIKAEEYLERQFKVTILALPGLKRLSVDCGLSVDATTVMVDKDDYEDYGSRAYDRLRFSFAHEIAHLIMHRPLLPDTPPRDYESSAFLYQFTKDYQPAIETQANMFAARFVVPTRVLLGYLASQLIEKISLLETHSLTVDGFAMYIAPLLAKEFGVSESMMRNRLCNASFSELSGGMSNKNLLITDCDMARIRALSLKEEEVLPLDAGEALRYPILAF